MRRRRVRSQRAGGLPRSTAAWRRCPRRRAAHGGLDHSRQRAPTTDARVPGAQPRHAVVERRVSSRSTLCVVADAHGQEGGGRAGRHRRAQRLSDAVVVHRPVAGRLFTQAGARRRPARRVRGSGLMTSMLPQCGYAVAGRPNAANSSAGRPDVPGDGVHRVARAPARNTCAPPERMREPPYRRCDRHRRRGSRSFARVACSCDPILGSTSVHRATSALAGNSSVRRCVRRRSPACADASPCSAVSPRWWRGHHEVDDARHNGRDVLPHADGGHGRRSEVSGRCSSRRSADRASRTPGAVRR